jgi:serine/threonine protein kinase
LSNKLPPSTQPPSSEDQLATVLEREIELETSSKVSYLRRRQPLGQGGGGIVHEAQQLALGRDVAIKTAHADLSTEEARELLLREARVTSLLEHPSIVPIYALAHSASGRPFIVMRRIQGKTWTSLLLATPPLGNDGALDAQLAILEDVARVAHFAHGQGVIHRDLKPDNIMISGEGQIYVLDWGAAVTIDDCRLPEVPHVDDVDTMAGTPAYMAPELALGVGMAMDARTDVYLLGAILHEVLVGVAPHEADEVLASVLSAGRSSKPKFDESVPLALAAICSRAMSRFNEDRFASGAEFADAIAAFRLQHESNLLVPQSKAEFETLEHLACEVEEEDPSSRSRFEEQFQNYRSHMDRVLTLWPDNPEAQEALQRAYELHIEVALNHGAVEVAETLLAQMPRENECLGEKVAEALQRRRVREKRHIELERAVDPQLGLGLRIGATIGFGAFWVATCACCILLHRAGHHDAVYFVFASLLGVGSLMMMFLPRISMLAVLGTGENRLTLAMFRTSWFVMAAGWLLSLTLGLPLPVAAAVHTLVGLTAVLIVTSAVDHRWWPLLVTEGTQLVLLVIWPEYTLFIMAIIGVLDGVGAAVSMKWTTPVSPPTRFTTPDERGRSLPGRPK